MGYDTNFSGGFDIIPELTTNQTNEINEFCEDRHGSNSDHEGFPGFWCDWKVTHCGSSLQHKGGEKFYNYVEWLDYLITHYFRPWGVTLTGTVSWQGEGGSDQGEITVLDGNLIRVCEATVTMEEATDKYKIENKPYKLDFPRRREGGSRCGGFG